MTGSKVSRHRFLKAIVALLIVVSIVGCQPKTVVVRETVTQDDQRIKDAVDADSRGIQLFAVEGGRARAAFDSQVKGCPASLHRCHGELAGAACRIGEAKAFARTVFDGELPAVPCGVGNGIDDVSQRKT